MTEQIDGQQDAAQVGNAYDPNVEQWKLADYLVHDQATFSVMDRCS